MYDPITALLTLPHPPPALKPGDKGWAVRLLHRLLAAQPSEIVDAPAAWLNPEQTVPELYDEHTQSLVRSLQRKEGLPYDGLCGPETWAWLSCRNSKDLGEVTLTYARQEAYAGAREIGGNNRGPYVRKYTGHEGTIWEWCAGYATWCQMQARKRLGLPTFDFGDNRLSSSQLVIHASKHGRLIHPQPTQGESEKKCGVTVRLGAPQKGDLCIVRGGKTGYRHTTLLDRIEGDRACVMEGNVRQLAWLTGYVGVNLGIARPGGYLLSHAVFARCQ